MSQQTSAGVQDDPPNAPIGGALIPGAAFDVTLEMVAGSILDTAAYTLVVSCGVDQAERPVRPVLIWPTSSATEYRGLAAGLLSALSARGQASQFAAYARQVLLSRA